MAYEYRPSFFISSEMEKMNTRILCICEIPGSSDILVGDHRGTIYRLSRDLKIEAFSRKTAHSGGIYVMRADEVSIYTRDTTGNIGKWDLATLEPLDFICSQHFSAKSDDEMPPVPVPSQALTIHGNHLLTVNARGEIISLDKTDMRLEFISSFEPESFAECILPHGDKYYITDCSGNVWESDASLASINKIIKTNHGNSHCIRYDKLYDRFWVTTDTLGSLVVLKGGAVQHNLPFTKDDIEWIEFNDKCTKLYVAAFDHYLHLFDNTERTPKYVEKYGPFKFFLKQVLISKNNCDIYVLLQSGEVYNLSVSDPSKTGPSLFGTNCIWNMASIPDAEGILCGTEKGQVIKLDLRQSEGSKYGMRISFHSVVFPFGGIRKALPLGGNQFIAVTESGYVFRAEYDGSVIWESKLGSMCRDLDIHPEVGRCLVATEECAAVEVDMETGAECHRLEVESPVYSVCYDDEGNAYVARRLLSSIDNGELTAKSHIHIFSLSGDVTQLKKIEVFGNVKRMSRTKDGRVLANGNGDIGISFINTKKKSIDSSYDNCLLNTTEGALYYNGVIYGCTYGYQVNTYLEGDNTAIDSQFTPEDYPKCLHCEEINHLGMIESILLVGGRGFLSMYSIANKIPELVRTIYI